MKATSAIQKADPRWLGSRQGPCRKGHSDGENDSAHEPRRKTSQYLNPARGGDARPEPVQKPQSTQWPPNDGQSMSNVAIGQREIPPRNPATMAPAIRRL